MVFLAGGGYSAAFTLGIGGMIVAGVATGRHYVGGHAHLEPHRGTLTRLKLWLMGILGMPLLRTAVRLGQDFWDFWLYLTKQEKTKTKTKTKRKTKRKIKKKRKRKEKRKRTMCCWVHCDHATLLSRRRTEQTTTL